MMLIAVLAFEIFVLGWICGILLMYWTYDVDDWRRLKERNGKR